MKQPSDDPTWTAVDTYLEGLLTDGDDALGAVLANQHARGLPDIGVSPTQGKLLAILARSVGATRILEFGTLGGYSTTWLARELPDDGVLVTLEYSPEHAAAARESLERVGLGGVVDVRVGAAADLAAEMVHAGEGPFDLVFIDADKPSNTTYFAAALEMTRPGSLIIVDNVVRDGGVIDPGDDPRNHGSRAVIKLAADEPRVLATVIQTVGRKGYDGLLIATVL